MSNLTIYQNPQILQVAEAMAKSKLVPESYRNNASDVLIAIDFAERLGASPLTIMQNLYVIHGKPSWNSAFLAACINNSRRFSPLRPVYNADKTACKCVATDLATGKECEGFEVSIEFARKEGYLTKQGSKWLTMPEQMLWYRAVSFFARMYCPDISAGIYTKEEVEDFAAPEAKQSPTQTLTNLQKPKEKIQTAEVVEEANPCEEVERICEEFRVKIRELEIEHALDFTAAQINNIKDPNRLAKLIKMIEAKNPAIFNIYRMVGNNDTTNN